jgi:hypothetical protein
LGAFADFVDDPEIDYIWRRYIVDETMYRTVFRGMDRIKLTQSLINRLIVLKSLKKAGILDFTSPLHNYFTFHGIKRFEHYEKSDSEEIVDEPAPQGFLSMKEDESKEIEEIRNKAIDNLFKNEIPKGLSNEWKSWLTVPSNKI